MQQGRSSTYECKDKSMKVHRYENGVKVKYYFDNIEEAKSLFEKWKEDFRKFNKVRTDVVDKSYERYCKELDETLENLKHDERS